MALYNCKAKSVLFLKLTIFVFVCFPLANYIFFKYFNFQPNYPKILHQGDASAANEKIELTNPIGTDSSTRVGRASYADPVHLWDSKSGKITDFHCFFSYNITSTNNTYLGDGLTFFLSPYKPSIPINPVGGLLGLFNFTVVGQTNNQIVAVDFDTKQDSWDPCVYGADVNSIESVSYIQLDDRLANGTTGAGWVIYDSTTKTFGVWQSYDGSQTFNKLFCLTDLRNVLPEWVSVGFSAGLATSSTERHTINISTVNACYLINLRGLIQFNLGGLALQFNLGDLALQFNLEGVALALPFNLSFWGLDLNDCPRLVVYLPVAVVIGSLIFGVLLFLLLKKKKNDLPIPQVGDGGNGALHEAPDPQTPPRLSHELNVDTRGAAIGTTTTGGGIDLKGSGSVSVGSTTINNWWMSLFLYKKYIYKKTKK